VGVFRRSTIPEHRLLHTDFGAISFDDCRLGSMVASVKLV